MLTKILRRIIPALLLMTSPLAFADALDISLNNNAVAFAYDASAASLMPGNADIQIGALYNDSMNTLADLGLLVKADEGDATELTLAVGTRALVGMIKNYIPGTTQNVGAIVIGGELGYAFPAAKQLSVAFYYFAGPHITTFGDADRANQWGLHADYEVNTGTKVYVEYRETNFGITATGQTATLDSGTYLGIKLAF
jgi:predicted porin